VAAGDVNEAGLAALAETKGPPGNLHAASSTSRTRPDVARSSRGRTAMGGLNGLINNAGILRDGLLVKKDKATRAITKLSKEQWDAVIGVNLTGATLMVREVVAKMVETARSPASSSTCRASRATATAASRTTWRRRPPSRPTPSRGRASSLLRRPRRRDRPRHDRDPDDPGHEPEGPRRARRERSPSAASACPRTSGSP
jgi:NAD(P)-dependent dehydrogenase (short-subunit alcohol dehydrogenase family)